jgi:hypothetical protein
VKTCGPVALSQSVSNAGKEGACGAAVGGRIGGTSGAVDLWVERDAVVDLERKRRRSLAPRAKAGRGALAAHRDTPFPEVALGPAERSKVAESSPDD